MGKISLTFQNNEPNKENQNLTLRQMAELSRSSRKNFADISNQQNKFQSPKISMFGDPLQRVQREYRNKSSSLSGTPKKKIQLSKGSRFANRQSVRAQLQVNPFRSKMKPSKVILASNLNDIFKNANEVFNLFSCFGNVKKILLMKNLNKTMVEYYDTESSLLCAVNLNNLKMDDTELRINYSKYATIDLEKNNKNTNSVNFNEIFIPGTDDHRYQ